MPELLRPVLPDSSIYIQLLRAGRDPKKELTEAFGLSRLLVCQVVRCEVLRGMVRPDSRTRLSLYFDLLLPVTINRQVWWATEDLAWRLDRAGKVLPLADLIIAACALRVGAAVLTNDKHFALIPQLQLASW